MHIMRSNNWMAKRVIASVDAIYMSEEDNMIVIYDACSARLREEGRIRIRIEQANSENSMGINWPFLLTLAQAFRLILP